tara:strand:- start:59 stop:658 length:600 start_codon:yes stop_codon:yes gene_type:complete
MTKLTNSEKHQIVRAAQSNNSNSHHHPVEKMLQLDELKNHIYGDILEVFGGQGNLTEYYSKLGQVTSLTKETTGDSFDYIYKLRAENKLYDVIDIDSYGYPSKFFPVVFEMIKDEGLLIFTFPVLGVQCVNGIVEQHFINFWGSARPTIGDVTGKVTDFALREWKIASLISVRKIKPIWRLAFLVKQEKATLFCNVRNR